MNDQNTENFWNDADMDMIRSILEEDNTVPRKMPASQRPDFYQSQNNAQPQSWDPTQPWDQPQQPQRVQPRKVSSRQAQPWDQPQQSFASQAPRNAYRQENPLPNPFAPSGNPFAGEVMERGKPHSEGKGLTVFLIILIALELAVILGVCTSWYLWAH